MFHLGGIAEKQGENHKVLMNSTAWELHSLPKCQLEPGTLGQLPHPCLISVLCVFHLLLVASPYHIEQEMKAQSRKKVCSYAFFECTCG